MDWYKSVDEEVPNEEEQTAIEPKKRGRPPIERDEDGMRKLDLRKDKKEMWVQKGVELLDGTVTDVFSLEGRSWWRDEKGHFRALPRYDTAEQLVDAIENWEHMVLRKIQDGEEIIPDFESLAIGLSVSVGTLKSWQKGDRGEAFKNIIDIEASKIAAVKNQLAMKGAIPQLVWISMLNAHHGYAQNRMEISVVDKREVQSADDLISRAKLLP